MKTILGLIVLAVGLRAAEDAPAWVKSAAAAPVQAYGKEVPAVVLLSDTTVTMDDAGKIVTELRYAIKVLTREGIQEAKQAAVYESGMGKIRDMRAWLVDPSGQARKLGKEDTAEVSLSDEEMYNNLHARIISASKKALPGWIFAVESSVEEKTVFSQFDWAFQEELPVVRARYSLTLPSGWEARSVTFNHDPVQPSVAGSTSTWELADLPNVEREAASPELSSLVPRVAVSVLPAGGRSPSRGFTNWTEVSTWLSELYDPQGAVTPEIEEKARALTASAKSEREKIEAIAAFAQSTRYVAIALKLARGGGMKPHLAAQSLAKGYGDCKDKANLMRALLKAVGIASYPVVLYSGDAEFVRDNWPSPNQFNHCILAIRVSEPDGWQSVVRHPALGPLLIFDATDPSTKPGDLPLSDRDGFGLIVAGKDGSLVRMPSPAGNHTDLAGEAKLSANGALAGTVREVSYGPAAARQRTWINSHDRQDFTRNIENWVASNISAAKVAKIETTPAGGQFQLDFEFGAPQYGQLMQNRLLVFRPGLLSQRGVVMLTQPKRKYPIVLRACNYSDTFRIELPSGFKIDELPNSGKLESPYGTFQVNVKSEGNVIVVTRSLELKSLTVPAANYDKVRQFFSAIAGAESEPVVLAKNSGQ
jgi:hypothetical protein